MWIERYYEERVNSFQKGKVNLLYGPRRVGKTTLINKMISKMEGKVFIGEGDDIDLRKILSSQKKSVLLTAFAAYDIIFIDEAQRIDNIGWALKILVDNAPNKTIIASGSSSFKLSSQVGEPLTGRSITKQLFPISLIELNKHFGGMHIIQNIEQYLVYGMYPEVLTAPDRNTKIDYLLELRNSYLLKDILETENIRNADQLHNLLKLIAFQIGKEVSLNELSNSLDISKHTVRRYLNLLEKSFILVRFGGFSRNLRKEISKSSRYYFYDVGLRNALISNFNSIDTRNDIGMLWENFMVMERIKKQHYHKIYSNNYYWRTYDQKEIDLIEERDGKLYGYEFKWKPKKQKVQKAFLAAYPDASVQVIHNENYRAFILD
jgi:predicted AAA+ superfamily ATPase